MIECETLETGETEYITITREEYDELICKSEKLSILTTAIKADVLPATLRRIVRQDEAAYKAGSVIGGFLKAFNAGINDGASREKDAAPEREDDTAASEAAT